jgi:5-methylcytosine-specific restriction enzyme A
LTKRNPPWTRDELILALELYFRVSPLHTSEKHPEIVTLSAILNRLGVHEEVADQDHFRNPNGVYMKLCNFLRTDPSYEGKGLDAGSKLDMEVWEEFASDRDRLRRTASAIRSAADVEATISSRAVSVSDDDEEFPEGRLLTRMHKTRERNTAAVQKKKRHVLRVTGRLQCEVCGFDFRDMYGDLGEGFAECHHTLPLAQLAESKSTRLQDLAIVCANCHRMIHRSKPMASIKEMQEIILAKLGTMSNKGVQLTAYSVRSAPASGSS